MPVKSLLCKALFAALVGLAACQTEAPDTSDATDGGVTEGESVSQTMTEEDTPTSGPTTAGATTSPTETSTSTVSVQPPTNFVIINSSKFASIDNGWANGPIDSSYCGSTFPSYLPPGWSVADDTRDARIAIELNTFGTVHVVLSTVTYSHELTVVPGSVQVHYDGSVQATAACPNRILIKHDDPVDPPVPPYVEVPITEYVTFNGMSYAMANNAPSTAEMVGGCDYSFYKLPDGWQVAEDNMDTKAVIITPKYPFQYICKVTASGRAYDYVLGSVPEYDVCGGEDMLVTAVSNELDATLVAVNSQSCGAIMISRPDPNAEPTWSSGPVDITNTFTATAEGHTYATLDNTPATRKYYDPGLQTCSDCCQDAAMAIPSGWQVATPEMPGYATAASQPWGTFCIGGLTYMDEACDYAITTTGAHATVRSCDQRVLLMRTPQNCVSGWTDWTPCPSQCPGVQTRNRTQYTHDAAYGGTCDQVEERECTEEQCNASPADRDNGNAARAVAPSALAALGAALLAFIL